MLERDCVCATCGAEGVTTRPDPVWCPDCMKAKLKPGQTYSTCQLCAAVGIEDAGDPFPGVCPDCLDKAMDGLKSTVQARTEKAAVKIAEDNLRQTGAPQQVFVARHKGENEYGENYDVREYIVQPVGVPLCDRHRIWGFTPVTVVDSIQGALL